eukprot:scaffold574225_cov34-Prasinocladus_malaysianus.AAC.1
MDGRFVDNCARGVHCCDTYSRRHCLYTLGFVADDGTLLHAKAGGWPRATGSGRLSQACPKPKPSPITRASSEGKVAAHVLAQSYFASIRMVHKRRIDESDV